MHWDFGKQQEQTDLGPHHDRNIGQREKYRYCQHLVNYWACLWQSEWDGL